MWLKTLLCRMIKLMKKLCLKTILNQSRLIETVDYLGAKIKVRPWTPINIELIQPLISKIYAELKKQDQTKSMFDSIVLIAQSKEYFNDVLTIIYETLHTCNQTIEFTNAEGITETFEFFDFQDFKENFTNESLVKILTIIWKQNVENNPFLTVKDQTPTK